MKTLCGSVVLRVSQMRGVVPLDEGSKEIIIIKSRKCLGGSAAVDNNSLLDKTTAATASATRALASSSRRCVHVSYLLRLSSNKVIFLY